MSPVSVIVKYFEINLAFYFTWPLLNIYMYCKFSYWVISVYFIYAWRTNESNEYLNRKGNKNNTLTDQVQNENDTLHLVSVVVFVDSFRNSSSLVMIAVISYTVISIVRTFWVTVRVGSHHIAYICKCVLQERLILFMKLWSASEVDYLIRRAVASQCLDSVSQRLLVYMSHILLLPAVTQLEQNEQLSKVFFYIYLFLEKSCCYLINV